MNVQPLFRIQQELDHKIVQNHQLQDKDLLPSKIMALRIEVAELCNETRVFKYWSRKGPSPKDTILEEYVDGVHFLLSIGLETNGHGEEFRKGLALHIGATEARGEAFEWFETVFRQIDLFSQSRKRQDYQRLFQDFILLGQALGFTWEDVEQAYVDKNRVNHERQEQGY